MHNYSPIRVCKSVLVMFSLRSSVSAFSALIAIADAYFSSAKSLSFCKVCSGTATSMAEKEAEESPLSFCTNSDIYDASGLLLESTSNWRHGDAMCSSKTPISSNKGA